MAHSRLRTHLLLLFVALTGSPLAAQEAQPVPESVPGTEHWVAFMTNGEQGRRGPVRMMGLYITSQVATTGFVEIPGQARPTTFSIDRGQIITIPIPETLELSISEEVGKGGIHVWSRAPVSVYANNARSASGAGFTVRPVSTWGTSYGIVTLPKPSGKVERTGEFLLVAAYDSTEVNITLAAPTPYKNRGERIVRTLNRGETMLVHGDPLDPMEADLTGTYISATRPVGVISGHVQAGIGDAGSTDATPGSHVSAMLAPNDLLGTEYVSTPLRSTGDRFRILSLASNTKVEFAHYRPGGGLEKGEKVLDNGEVLDLNTISGGPITGPVYWKANKAFSIVQLRKSTSGSAGLPAMINLVPIDKFSIRSTFGTPAKLGLSDLNYGSHSLTVIARADNQDALKGIMLDGKALYETAPALLTQRIGSTNLYTVTLGVDPGSHTILSNNGATFTGLTSAMTTIGDPADYYVNVLPSWLPQIGPDVKAPRLMTTTVPRRGQLSAIITDSTPEYFSGVGEIAIVNSPGWYQEPSNIPEPDVDAKATFTATADPAGPLYAKLTDRDGNQTTVKLSDGACFKTATADRQSVERSLEVGQSGTEPIVLTSNPCGDAATVLWADKGKGTAVGLIGLSFAGGSTPLSIPAGGAQTTLNIAIDASMASPGTYSTVVSVRIDDSTAMIPVTITVNAPSAVALENESANGLLSGIYPNPVRDGATISLGRELGGSGSITITDRLGRMISDLSSEALAGRRTLRWNGLDQQGSPVPAGTYFISIADGSARLVRGITVIR